MSVGNGSKRDSTEELEVVLLVGRFICLSETAARGTAQRSWKFC